MKQVEEFFRARDRFAAHCGIEVVEVEEGRCVARMRLTEHHLNGVNTAHGGAIFTLADLAFAGASNSYGTVAVAINVSISFMQAATEGVLTAVAEEKARNPRLASYTVTITDEAGDLIAIFQGMVYRKKERLEEFAG